jgi:hypothetical protein
MAMKHQVEQYRIDTEGGLDAWKLEQFAHECGTKIEPVFPIFIVLTDGKLSAYFYAQPNVTIRPTVAPEWEPRAFYETARRVIHGTQQMFCNPIWLIDPESKLASQKWLSKVGLKRQPLSVWETR